VISAFPPLARVVTMR